MTASIRQIHREHLDRESLVPPYGGDLLGLMADEERAASIRQQAREMASIDLNWGQICQLELLMNGALSPLRGYMGSADLASVLESLKLADGRAWPAPVMLAADERSARDLKPGQSVALRDAEGFMLAVLHISEIWPADPEAESALANASLPLAAPLASLLARPGQFYIAGAVEGIALPPRHDFPGERLGPAQLRDEFCRRGWSKVLCFQPTQPMHRPQLEFALQAAAKHGACLLIQPTAGADPIHESGHIPLVRACQVALHRLPKATTFFALSPRMPLPTGPREALLHALIARNYGCTHLIVGGNPQAGGTQRRGQDHVPRHRPSGDHEACLDAIGVALVPFPRMVYVEAFDDYLPQEEAPVASRKQAMGGLELNRRLKRGQGIPEWFSYPEVVEELNQAFRPRSQQGFTVFFTGLSGAGKSTIAKALAVKLMEIGSRRVTLLDGDIVRRNLSSELGFSKQHRDINIRRIGFVASEITKHGGTAICAPIAPYQTTRCDVRNMIEKWGGFIEIHVATPIEVCEGRDCKGLYAKARAGLIPEFTGISDPYEIPKSPELSIDASRLGVNEAVQNIILRLEHEGYLQ